MNSINEPAPHHPAGFAGRIDVYRDLMEQDLGSVLPQPAASGGKLAEAMRYAVLGGGKRIRPLLCFATAECLGLNPDAVLPAATAVELIHAFSLVHDDLPAMDDDDLRRGKPATHKAFDEATAILAGDALQSMAFEQLAQRAPAQQAAGLVVTLAQATGATGMTGGQAIDLASEGQQIDLDTLERLHRLKTGALLSACVSLVCQWDPESAGTDQAPLADFGRDIGLAFQIHDDVLDATRSSEELGKPGGSDQAANKSTWVSLRGLKTARNDAERLHQSALRSLNRCDGDTEGLRWLANWILRREY